MQNKKGKDHQRFGYKISLKREELGKYFHLIQEMRNIILLLISLLFFLSLLVMVVTKGHTCFNKPPDSSCKFVKYE